MNKWTLVSHQKHLSLNLPTHEFCDLKVCTNIIIFIKFYPILVYSPSGTCVCINPIGRALAGEGAPPSQPRAP